jgi:hypothetical protein
MTIGRWLEIVAARGWRDPATWMLTRDAARAALPSVRRLVRSGEEEDLVSELIVLARGVPDCWRRPELRGVPLARWFAGVLRNLIRARRRNGAGAPLEGDVLDPRSDPGADEADPAVGGGGAALPPS